MKLFTSITFYGFLVCLMTGVSVLGQSNHLLQLYDGFSSTGSWVNINNYVDNLQSLSFNDIASSLCVPRGMQVLSILNIVVVLMLRPVSQMDPVRESHLQHILPWLLGVLLGRKLLCQYRITAK